MHIGVYGDVQRVKILYNKKDSALIQMAEPHQALLGECIFFSPAAMISMFCLVNNPFVKFVLKKRKKSYFHKFEILFNVEKSKDTLSYFTIA